MAHTQTIEKSVYSVTMKFKKRQNSVWSEHDRHTFDIEAPDEKKAEKIGLSTLKEWYPYETPLIVSVKKIS